MRIEPASGPLRGAVRVPGDKSVSHRAFLVNALGRGSARVRGALDAGDLAATRRLVEAVGCGLTREADAWILRAPDALREPADVVDCGNSGTTMRLGVGLLAHVDGVGVLTGDASLRARPMKRVVEPLRAMGARIDGRAGGTRAPLVVRGGDLVHVSASLPVASAQVKSALLLAGRDCGVRVREPRASRDHTERMLEAMGASLTRDADGASALAPGPWGCVDVDVPGDLSSAAFWLVAASLVPGSRVELPGVGLNPTRTGVIDALRAMGAAIEVALDSGARGEPRGDVVVEHAALRGTRIDGALALACLDELPVLAVAAACASGETVIADAAELRVKESDRIARVVAGLRALGAEVEERPDGMCIAGGGLRGGDVRIDADGDHRLAMAFAIAGLVATGGLTIAHADVVKSSYPAFYEHLEGLR